jgi:hypothetical protein
VDAEVANLISAFKAELDGCHAFLDQAGVPRVIMGRVLSLKDRIAVLVEADREYVQEVGERLRKLRQARR